MKNLFLSAASLLFVSGAFAQTSLFKPADVQLSFGPQLYTAHRTGDLAQYRQVFPNSQLLPANTSDYQEQNLFTVNGSAGVFLGTSLQIRNKEKNAYNPYRNLRVGVSFFSSYSQSSSFYRQESTPYDTLRGSNGANYPIDSVYTHHIGLNTQAQNLVVDLAMIFRSKKGGRWNLYGGFGLQAGVSFNRQAQIYSNEVIYYSSPDHTGFFGGNDENTFKRESQPLDASFLMNVYAPFGIDWQTGKKRPFFQQLHLFYEMRPGIMMSGAVDGSFAVNPGVNNQFGLRVTFQD